jgi:hypothetical protein
MTPKRKLRSESLLSEIRDLTNKVREVRLELEELVKRPDNRGPAWQFLASHGERSVASDRERRRDRARPPGQASKPERKARAPVPTEDTSED